MQEHGQELASQEIITGKILLLGIDPGSKGVAPQSSTA
jgi:hypothetical protein